VHFVVAALGRDCDEFTLHIYASLAEQERKMISERVKAAHAISKSRGRKFGLALLSKAERRRVHALSMAALQKMAADRAEAYRLHIEWALRQPGFRGRPIAFNTAAMKLNERGIETPMGGLWTGTLMQRMAERLRLNHPTLAALRREDRAEVQDIWQQHPGMTIKEVTASFRRRHHRPIGIHIVKTSVRECRLAAANRSRVYKRAGWLTDRWTAERIQIIAICKRHPDYTATQVLKALWPAHSPRVKLEYRRKWISETMNDCWEALGRRGPRYVKGWPPERRKLWAERMRQIRRKRLGRWLLAPKGKARAAQRRSKAAAPSRPVRSAKPA